MKIIRRFVEEHNVVLTKVHGKLTDQRILKYASALSKKRKEKPSAKTLVDFRNISCMKELTAKGATEYARYEPEKPDHRLALLIPDDPLSLGMARAYQTFAQEKKSDVEIFTDFDRAIAWLKQTGQTAQEDEDDFPDGCMMFAAE